MEVAGGSVLFDGSAPASLFTGAYSLTTAGGAGGDVRVGGSRFDVLGNAGAGAGGFGAGPAGRVSLAVPPTIAPPPRVGADGSLGPAGALAGPRYELTASGGRRTARTCSTAWTGWTWPRSSRSCSTRRRAWTGSSCG